MSSGTMKGRLPPLKLMDAKHKPFDILYNTDLSRYILYLGKDVRNRDIYIRISKMSIEPLKNSFGRVLDVTQCVGNLKDILIDDDDIPF